MAKLINHDERDPPIGGAGRGGSDIPDPWHLGALTPGPGGKSPEILARYPASVVQVDGSRSLPLHQPHALSVVGHVRHHLRVPDPMIGHHEGRGQPRSGPA